MITIAEDTREEDLLCLFFGFISETRDEELPPFQRPDDFATE